MAISTKIRKTLWARSGNRCAICKNELVAEEDRHDRNLNLGDECHIISEQPNGPRHIANYEDGYDSYKNLILLCKNHHKTIDELWETFTVDILRKMKTTHEKWVRAALDNAKEGKTDPVKKLPRITTGKQIVEIILNVHAYQFDHDEFQSQEEADFVSDFLQNIQDWGEVSGFGDFEIGKQAQLAFDLNKEIKELEDRGFFIFGERKKSRMTNDNKDDLGSWNIAFIAVMRKDNPSIVNE